ncbi:MFS transporter [Pantoea sp. GL120224-02]|uniref:MFS transporter n=1 Tax=Pantoea sp. GL120224-02 TaxID=1378084 RepID=UPI000BC9523F|nr:MFS transporter [Pantoea sp. GL120224-02]SNY74097.1 MFS transporter, putative metabolite transport protein [Pantoea sp. GL120224-02]
MSNNMSIEDVPFSRFHRLLTVRSGGGSFVDGYVLSIIGIAMTKVSPALGLSPLWEGLIAASALIGIFFGGFMGGVLTDRLGRRMIYFVGPTLFIVCSLAQFWVQSGETLFALRFMTGVAVGIEYPVATAFLVEFMPKKSRGPCLATLTILWFAGAATAYLVGEALLNFGGVEAWRYTLASTAVIGALLFIVRMGTPESPRWLISKGRHQEAEAVIRRVYGDRFSLKNLPPQPENNHLSFGSLLHSGYGKRMAFVTIFWTCSVIPVFAVYAFAPKVLQALHLSGDWASYGSIAITLLFVVGCMIGTRLVNSLGRRKLLLHSFLWSGLALLLLGALRDGPSMIILLMFGAYALFIGGAQVLQLVYPNEIFPTEIRAGAVGIGTSMSRIGAAVGTYLVPISLQTIGIGPTMYIAAGITFIGLIVSWFLAPETASRNLDDAASLEGESPAPSVSGKLSKHSH